MTKNCFVIMPFSATTEKHTETYWNNLFSKFVKPSIEKFGYTCNRSQAQPSNIVKGILKELYEADLVLAVLTDYNANVWYELGIRHALRKGTIMMIEKEQKLPFDISQYGVIIYEDSVSGVFNFEETLKTFIYHIEQEQPDDSPLADYMKLRVQHEYHQRLETLQSNYDNALKQIMELLKEMRKPDVISEPSGESKHKQALRRVLWVDDHPNNNRTIVDLYRRQNVEFDLALSTEQAIDYLRNKDYSLIISDLGRGINYRAGVTMIHDIKRHFSKLPPIVIFASSKGVEQYGEEAIKAGAALATASVSQLYQKMSETLGL